MINISTVLQNWLENFVRTKWYADYDLEIILSHRLISWNIILLLKYIGQSAKKPYNKLVFFCILKAVKKKILVLWKVRFKYELLKNCLALSTK